MTAEIEKTDPAQIDTASLVVLFVVAFGLRLIYILQSTDNPLFGVALVDAKAYANWAERMAAGVWLWDGVGNYLPVYPAFLAIQQILFGTGPLVNKIIQSLMGSLSAVLMAQAAARAFNRQVGLIAGYLLATYWMLVVFESEMYAESFAIFFQSLALWLLIRHTRSVPAVAGAGLAFALSAAARANLLAVLPVAVYWLLKKAPLQKKRAPAVAAWFCMAAVVVLGPIVVRNYQISGVPMLRAQATWSLYAGLSPQFEGLHPPTGIAFDKYMNRPFAAGLRTEAQIERYWGRQVLQLLKEQPLAVAANFARRLLIFFNQLEWSQEFDVYAYRSYSPFLSLPWTGFWLIGPLGLLGFCLLRRPLSAEQWLTAGFAAAGFVSIIAFKASDRYRLPFAVLLSVFAALAIWQLYRQAQAKEKQPLVRSAMLLAVFCLLCWPDWAGLEAKKTARHEFFIGLHKERTGRLEEAADYYRQSMQRFDWDADSPYRVGRILFRQKEPGRALVFAREALRREPQFPEAMNLTAYIYLQAGLIDAADRLAAESLALNPVEKETLLLLAEIRRRQGETDEEMAFLARAALEARNVQAAMVYAERLTDHGDYGQALQLYDRVLRSRSADRHFRVQAAMLAGLLQARFAQDAGGAYSYWQTVWEEFADYRFFALQAGYLIGKIDEPQFRQSMQKDALWQASAAYAVGLKHLLGGDRRRAEVAFERCLALGQGAGDNGGRIPQKWAAEDLQRLRQ
jgi:tetratricopeptide (TPR) repeat protein